MRRLIIAFLLVVSAFGLASAQTNPAPDWYQGKNIKDIKFQGLKIVTSEDVGPIIKEFKGQPFSDEVYTTILARVYELDFFDEIQPEALPGDASYSSLIISFTVKERPAVMAVLVQGNEGLRSSEILEAATVKPRTIFIASRLRLDEIAIRRLYQGKGYPDIRVSSQTNELADGSVEVIFRVEEGDQNLVASIGFEGVSAVSVNALKGDLPLKEKGLFQSGHFTELGLEESRKAIELYYRKRGYADAKVQDVRRDTIEDARSGAKRLSLVFVVDEGLRYIYGGMDFEGNTIFTTDELMAMVRQKPGAVFNYERLVQDQERVTDLYFENGYIFNGFDFRELRDDETSTISFLLLIEERPQAVIEDVIVRGNLKTKDFVIRREIPLETGEIFSKTKIMDGLRNLYNLQYFSAVNPSYEPGSQDLAVDLIVTVEEQSTADVQFGMTFTPSAEKDSFPLTGLIQWNDRNFMGKGQTMSVGSNFSLASQDLTLGFKENWLFDQRWSGGVDFSFRHDRTSAPQDILGPVFTYDESDNIRVPDPYTSMEDYLAAGSVVPSDFMMQYDTWTFSLGFSTGYTFKTGIGDLGIGTGVIFGINQKTYESDKYRPFEEAVADNLDTWLWSNTLYIRGLLNGLDIWYDPSQGYFASQRFSMVGFHPNEQYRFFKAETRLEGYLTLWDYPLFSNWSLKTVLGAHSGYSTLLPWFGESEALPSETQKLRIDGTFIGRGWSDLVYLSKGTSLWENWIELRTPLVPRVLSLDGFLDIATVVDSESGLLDLSGYASGDTASFQAGSGLFDVGLNNFAFSLGWGLRFTIPQFPFRLYFAKRFFHDGSGFDWVGGSDAPWDFVLSITTPLN
ncbi:MAG: outer membrane protein assembly factor BamA [Spirochaetes bacterium RIFOXYC1_FULL_54_7]|nr:MAG: outer membrane protein assembly factor BamA [Spirochaetes bacterium RIFOXYC1_FULL_54_7]